jgi:hypothetical protein
MLVQQNFRQTCVDIGRAVQGKFYSLPVSQHAGSWIERKVTTLIHNWDLMTKPFVSEITIQQQFKVVFTKP